MSVELCGSIVTASKDAMPQSIWYFKRRSTLREILDASSQMCFV